MISRRFYLFLADMACSMLSFYFLKLYSLSFICLQWKMTLRDPEVLYNPEEVVEEELFAMEVQETEEA